MSGCLRDFRNKPFPTRAKIEYYQNTLTVLFHTGMTNNDQDYEVCLRAENVQLPKYGYFGVSAATGGLADDHDVFHFLTTSLHPQNQQDPHGEVPQMDSEKLSKEYQEYQKKLDQQKEDYRKDHPDEQKTDDNMEDWFETDNQRELRQIWQAQSVTTEVLRELSKKLDEVIGRQERTLGLLSASGQQLQPGQPQQQYVPPPAGTQQQYSDTIRRSEVDSLMNSQNILTSTVREIRTALGELHQRTDTILGNQNRQPTGQATGYDLQSVVAEMRDGLNQVKNGVAAVNAKVAQPQPLTACPNKTCLGLTPFLITAVVQLLIILGYNLYRYQTQAEPLKFFF